MDERAFAYGIDPDLPPCPCAARREELIFEFDRLPFGQAFGQMPEQAGGFDLRMQLQHGTSHELVLMGVLPFCGRIVDI